MIEEKKHKIMEDEDYIDSPKFKYSLKELLEKNPDGVDNEAISKVLNMSVEEVEEVYQSAIKKLQKTLEN